MNTFDEYRSIVEVFIADKHNKASFRFSFVRFREVKNLKKFQEQINEMWFGCYKVRSHLTMLSKLMGEAFKTKMFPPPRTTEDLKSGRKVWNDSFKEALLKGLSSEVGPPFPSSFSDLCKQLQL